MRVAGLVSLFRKSAREHFGKTDFDSWKFGLQLFKLGLGIVSDFFEATKVANDLLVPKD